MQPFTDCQVCTATAVESIERVHAYGESRIENVIDVTFWHTGGEQRLPIRRLYRLCGLPTVIAFTDLASAGQ